MSGQGAEEAAIRLLRARHNAALAGRDLAGAMAIVARDHVLVSGDGGILRSLAEVRKAWARAFADPAYRGYVRTPERIEIGQADGVPTAAESGIWTEAGGAARLCGHYLVHWRKSADGWRAVAEVYVTLGRH